MTEPTPSQAPDTTPAQQVAAHIEHLKSANSETRARAAYALAELGEAAREAISALITLVRDEDRIVRVAAVNALGMIGGTEVLPTLREANAHDQSFHVRRIARRGIDAIEDKSQGIVRLER
ncbi:MAG TPA: HEAT repeat domain-containing protein [Gemmataceae bacterium]|nr:HEAT repeat domain-containing protein [Gemmataceae bacterium]